MKYKKRVLILEAGGPCSIAAIKLLRKRKDIYLIGCDMDKYAAGLYLCHKGFEVPPSTDKLFPSFIHKIISKYEVDLVLPTFENGFRELSKFKRNFITDFNSALLCKDKLLFNQKCSEIGLPVPHTVDFKMAKNINSWPIYVKPRFGVGSRNNYIVSSERKSKLLFNYLDNENEMQYVAQELLIGEHWNVDVLVDEGKFITAIPRRDLKQNAGNCMIVEIKNYPELVNFARHVQRRLSINSVFNLEVFEISPKKFVINEINVRFGGGIIFGALAGCDIVSYLVTKDKSYLGKLKPGFYSRYYEELRSDPSLLQ